MMCKRMALIFCGVIVLTACSFAPKYHRPAMVMPVSYKEYKKIAWVKAIPEKAAFGRGPWWEMYGDPILDALEKEVSCTNQNIKVALARLDEARADLNEVRSALYPKALGVANMYRQQLSHNSAVASRRSQATNNTTVFNTLLYNDNLLIANLYYELDVWGRVRNSVAAAKNLAQASAADVMVVALSMHAELANDYFILRGYDEEQRILDATVRTYQKALDLTRRRFKGGVVSVVDVDQAQVQLDIAKTAATDIHLQRAQVEHAIAVLIGRPPATFAIKPRHYRPKLVTIAPDLPSTLLERRPDIAEAALRMQAANANIGVAWAAFFPQINLSLGSGLESGSLSDLLSRPSLVWALGSTTATALLNSGNMPLLTQTIFDGGKLKALTDRAYAEYHETVSAYRQTVLTAFKEVEDSLVALHELDKEYESQTAAVHAANRALIQATYRYKEGLTNYLDVVVAENTALETRLANVSIMTRRQRESVLLIKALGGGWCSACLQKGERK